MSVERYPEHLKVKAEIPDQTKLARRIYEQGHMADRLAVKLLRYGDQVSSLASENESLRNRLRQLLERAESIYGDISKPREVRDLAFWISEG